jgi:hypothetical protein
MMKDVLVHTRGYKQMKSSHQAVCGVVAKATIQEF